MDYYTIAFSIGCMLFWTIYEGSLENLFQNIIFQYVSYLGYSGMCYIAIKYFLNKISKNNVAKLFLFYIKIFEDSFKINVDGEDLQRNQSNFPVENLHETRYEKKQVPKIKMFDKTDEFQYNSNIKKLEKGKVKNTNNLNEVSSKIENFQIINHCENKDSTKEIQKKDIDILRTVSTNIENFVVGKYDINHTIISIGRLMSQLNYCSIDAENVCIRNKYGFIRRNRNKLINKNGIYFEIFVNFQIILEENIYEISNFVVNDIKLELINLKVKINYIINKEESKGKEVTEIKDVPLSTPTIFKITRKYYTIFLFIKMKEKLMELGEINFSCKDDRYHFAHVFTHIGEYVCQIIEDPVLKEQLKIIYESFKILTKSRHKLIHRHRKLIKIGNAENNFPNENIQVILNYFSEFIDNNNNNNNDFSQLQFDGDIYEATKSIEIFLKESITQKSQDSIQSINNITTQIHIQQVKNYLKPYILSASKVFENERLNENQKRLKLQKINGKYQKLIKSIESEIDKIGLPKEINLSNKNNIVRYAKALEHYNLLPKQHSDVPPLNNNGKFIVISNDILDEFEYYRDVVNNPNLSSIKRNNIILHIITVIGQYLRDLNIKNNKLKLSKLIIQANSAAIRSRNEGLAHNPISLNQSILFQRFEDDIISAQKHFEASLFVNSSDVFSNDLMIGVGLSFVTLGDFNSAINIFKSTLNDCIERGELGLRYFHLLWNLAYVYKLCERYVDSYEIYEIVFECLENLDPAEIPDKDKLHFSAQYHRIAHSKAIFSQYKEAIDCCYKGEMIFNHVGLKIGQAFYLLCDGQKEEAWNLVENIIKNMNMNPTERCEILRLKASLIKNVLNGDEMLERFNDCINEIENIYKNNISCFKLRYNDRYLRTDISILNLKVEHFILGMKLGKAPCYLILDHLKDQYDKIKSNIENVTGFVSFIIKLHISFCEAFLLLNSENCLYYFINAFYFYLSGKDFLLKSPQIKLNFHQQFVEMHVEIANYVINNF